MANIGFHGVQSPCLMRLYTGKVLVASQLLWPEGCFGLWSVAACYECGWLLPLPSSSSSYGPQLVYMLVLPWSVWSAFVLYTPCRKEADWAVGLYIWASDILMFQSSSAVLALIAKLLATAHAALAREGSLLFRSCAVF